MKIRSTSMLMVALISVLSISGAEASQKGHALSHAGTAAQQAQAVQWNSTHAAPRTDLFDVHGPTWNVLRPFSEIETTGYVALSGEDAFELAGLRDAIAKNLPAGVTLVIYITDKSEATQIKQKYTSLLGERLKFLLVPNGNDTVWGRDALPFPVYLKSAGSAPTIGLVDSIYPQNFEPDAAFDQALGSMPMVSTNTYFRGGNLIMDTDGNCFAERAREIAAMSDPETFLKTYFGCSTVTILDHDGGIGDLDERLKLLANKEALTDDPKYATLLTNRGYSVHMIPTTGSDMETYMNTLYVNGTIFVPQMGKATKDAAAVKAYNDLGLKAVGVYTQSMADDGQGNIHCVTMNYPVGTFTSNLADHNFVEFVAPISIR